MLDNDEVIAIASDHAGFEMKEYLKAKLCKSGYNIKDFGTGSTESVDYPDIIHPLAKAVNDGTFKRAIVLCGSGVGVSIVANKYPGVRAALAWDENIARLSRQHNDANVLALPARFISNEKAEELAGIFLATEFEGGRHQRRVEKISRIIR